MFGRDARQHDVSTGARQVAHAHRADPEGDLALMLEDAHAQIALGHIDQHARLQLDLLQGRKVARLGDAVAGGTVDIVEHHPRQSAPRQPARIVIAVDGVRSCHGVRPSPLP